MSFSINIDLSDKDLEHFRQAQQNAAKSAATASEADLIAAANKLLLTANNATLPEFIGQRLSRLSDLISMLQDEGWALQGEDRQRVLSALVYFADPTDIIPDTVPVLGFLDDAIMIEIYVRELRHELDAYDDFCDYREREAKQRGLDPATIGRADFLTGRRDELVDRMHRRRECETGTGYGSSSGYALGKSYQATGASWRPRYR